MAARSPCDAIRPAGGFVAAPAACIVPGGHPGALRLAG
jgi:hypothetical protein